MRANHNQVKQVLGQQPPECFEEACQPPSIDRLTYVSVRKNWLGLSVNKPRFLTIMCMD